ncbi:MAG TPA: hypothetical protein VKY15_08255 [Acidimicrobiales bacterium]|nr:hypothetical protein [Acidimicrobiales bacterium]
MAGGREVGLILSADDATVIDRLAVVVAALGVAESVTWTVKENVPIPEGVPETVPVFVSSESPGGSEPPVNDQV